MTEAERTEAVARAIAESQGDKWDGAPHISRTLGSDGSTWTPIRARSLATGKIGWHVEHVTTACELWNEFPMRQA